MPNQENVAPKLTGIGTKKTKTYKKEKYIKNAVPK
jgi:hypothetical protein